MTIGARNIILVANEVSEKTGSLKLVNGLTKRVAGDEFDEWKKLDGHSFTIGFLIESLRTNDEEYIKLYGSRPVKDATSSNISKGKGFTSEVFRYVVSFVDSVSESDVYTTVLKIPSTAAIERGKKDASAKSFIEKKAINFARFHVTEMEFYNNLAPTLDIPLIKVFKTLPWVIGESEGVLHMEDITGKAEFVGFAHTLNISQIKEIVRHLAHMHKICLTSDENHQKLWKGKYNENYHVFGTIVRKTGDYERFLDICGDRDFFEPLLKKYRKFGSSTDYNTYAFAQSWKDLDLQSVFVHGDFYAGNIMWKLDEHGNSTNQLAAIFDWQVVHEGSPMADIARMLATSVDGYIRRQAETFIIEFYYDLLKKEMEEAGKSCPYTVEQLKKAYNYIFLCQCYGVTLLTAFYHRCIEEENHRIKKAKVDNLIIRCKHALEDMDKHLTGSMKHVFEKFG
ncbi:hypothetical protein FO519_006135 [Halicephalobus sp. NKZ332]|nr:hypothetical protein FO519_006135 [Halicephalobus sp. NKZ332]